MLSKNLETISEIFGAPVKREDNRNRDLFPADLKDNEVLYEVYRTNADADLELPNVILPPSGDVEDFFATVATYYQDKSPISALTYVLGSDAAGLFKSRAKTNKNTYTDVDKVFIAACLGAVVGEATITSQVGGDASKVNLYPVCKRTLAYCLCRAGLLYGANLQSQQVTKRWVALRELTGLSAPSYIINSVSLIYNMMIDSSMKMPAEVKKLQKLLNQSINKKTSNDTFLISFLTDVYPDAARYTDEMLGVFDGRMSAFTRIIEVIQSSSRGTEIDEIAAAIACNSILPGSFAHAEVLHRLSTIYPASLVWYGFFSALTELSQTGGVNSGIMLKLKRDLLEEFSYEKRPSCDLSIDELVVLSRTRMRSENIRPGHNRSMLVSLLPGVDVYARFGPDETLIRERAQDVLADRTREKLIAMLEDALNVAREGARSTNSQPQKRSSKKYR